MEFKDGVERLRSTFDQSNNYARYIMLMLVVALPAFTLLGRKGRLLLGAATVGLLPLLFLTYARTAWIGLVAGVLAMTWVSGRRRLIGALTVLGLASLALPGVWHVLTHLSRPDTGQPGSQNNSVAWRFSYWKQISSLGLQRPLTGLGPNGTVAATVDAKEPHNEYLRAAIEGGVIGLIVYLTLLTVATVVAVRVLRRATSTYERAVGLAGFGVMVAVIVAGLASNIVLSVSFMWYFAFVLAIVDQVARAQFRRTSVAEEL
jgi:putative inorganic carbon (HCO3(-)) transporter